MRLQKVPRGQRKEFLAQAILCEGETDRLREMLQQILCEKQKHEDNLDLFQESTTVKEVPQQTIDFLASLCD